MESLKNIIKKAAVPMAVASSFLFFDAPGNDLKEAQAQTGVHFSNQINRNGASLRFSSGVLPDGRTYGGFGYSIHGMNFDIYSMPQNRNYGNNSNNNSNNRRNTSGLLNLPEAFLCNSYSDRNNNNLVDESEFIGRRDIKKEGCFKEGEPITLVMNEFGTHEGQNLSIVLLNLDRVKPVSRSDGKTVYEVVYSGEDKPLRLKRGQTAWQTFDRLNSGNYWYGMVKNGEQVCGLKFHVHPKEKKASQGSIARGKPVK